VDVLLDHENLASEFTPAKRKTKKNSLGTILNSIADALIVRGRDGAVQLYNAAAKEMFGPEVFCHKLTDLPSGYDVYNADRVTPTPCEEFPSIRALRGENSINAEFFYVSPRHPTGLCIEVSTKPLRNSNRKEVLGAVSVIRNISERRGAENKVIEDRFKQLATIVECSSDAIVSADPTFTILSWNRGAEKLYGYSEAEAIGKKAYDLFPSYELEGTQSRVRETVLKGKKCDCFETWRTVRDGSRILISLSLFPLVNSSGEIIGGCGVARDITALRKVEDEARELARRLARSNEELQQFAYIASHDLQEPLRMVSSYVKLLSSRYKDALDGTAREYIDFALCGISRMKRLIQGLLEYSQLEQPACPFKIVDCEKLLSQVLRSLDVAIAESRATFRVESLPKVRGHEIRLGQVFQNLISNAIKFCGNRPPEIRISGGVRDGQCLYCVTDNGIGIAPEMASRVFQIFQKGHSSEKFPGTGMGLAICKRIIEQHGGRIWFESTPGVSTSFYFVFPGEV
jgi:PAS domain S-box-containing protein